MEREYDIMLKTKVVDVRTKMEKCVRWRCIHGLKDLEEKTIRKESKFTALRICIKYICKTENRMKKKVRTKR